MRAIACLPLLLLVAAGSAAPLRPGLWELTNRPEAATLDGRSLDDLPYTQPEPERVCLTPAEAADAARWLTRDLDAGCSVTAARFNGETAELSASCPPTAEGFDKGSARLNGLLSPDAYDLRFATLIHGENGRMGFSGRMTGRRLGDCPG